VLTVGCNASALRAIPTLFFPTSAKVADLRNARIDAAAYAVMAGGVHVSTIIDVGGERYTVAVWPNMRQSFPGAWRSDGMGGAVLRIGDVFLTVAPTGQGSFDCALVGMVRHRHYDVRFSAPTLHAAGSHFREVLL
jgi:hypothetical protein